jgi:hypothetical protein
MAGSRGWDTEVRAGRRQHVPESEALLTEWMGRTLALTWTLHERPAAVERDVIASMGPPLNFAHNRGHPNWQQVAERRQQWNEGST